MKISPVKFQPTFFIGEKSGRQVNWKNSHRYLATDRNPSVLEWASAHIAVVAYFNFSVIEIFRISLVKVAPLNFCLLSKALP
jgi:hypothetical protein